MTDGSENDSGNADIMAYNPSCFGGDTQTTTAPQFCSADWGLSDSLSNPNPDLSFSSWEQRVERSVTNWYDTTGVLTGATGLSGEVLDVYTPNATTCATYPNGNKNINWVESIQYNFSTTNALVAPRDLESFFTARSATAAVSAMTASGDSTGIPPTELAFFQALGSSTPKSSFQQTVYTPGTVYGVPHAVPGDVDNSGCTDQADLSQILQSDVWLQQAPPAPPPPGAVQHTTLADLNGDGWVNQADITIVLDNWGAGCNPLPQPPQGGYVAIPYVPTGLAATPGASEVSLVWTASQSAASYSVLRSTTSGSGFVSIASGLTATSYTDTTVTNGTTYYYEVTATDSQGTSAASAQVSATPEVAPPTPCANPVTWTSGQSGSFNTTGAVCGRIAGTIDGWGCSNFTGRTIKVDNTTVTCGDTPLPAAWSDGYHYFSISAGNTPRPVCTGGDSGTRG